METSDKILIQLRLAASLRTILIKNKKILASNQLQGIEDVSLVDSIRQLEASSRLSYTIVQGVFAGKRDIQFSSLITIVEEGFGISFTEFAKIYDSISDEDIRRVKKEISLSKRKRELKKKKD